MTRAVFCDDVPDVLRRLHASGLTIGISNTQRCLGSFQKHFALEGLFAALSSSDRGYMKPHPGIFESALRTAGVPAQEAAMVGDSIAQDVGGARSSGMRGVRVARSGRATGDCPPDVPVIASVREPPPLL